MLSKLQGLETGIRVGGVEVKPVESVRDLGVTFECHLIMRAHINKIVSACYYHVRRIRQLRHCLDKDDQQRLGFCVVEDRLLQRRTRWITSDFTGSFPAIHQRRMLASSRTSDIATMSAMFLRDLHWLPIRERISYNVYLMIFNIVNGTAKTYLVTRISPIFQVGVISVLPLRDCVTCLALELCLVPGLSSWLTRWPGMVSLPMFEPFATLFHSNQHSKLFFQLAYSNSLQLFYHFCGLFLYTIYFIQNRLT